MEFKHVLWDWNGTLIDDASLTVRLCNRQIQSQGLKVDLRTYRKKFCIPISDFYLKLGFDFKKKSIQEISDRFHTEYRKLSHRCRLQPGARKLLAFFRKRGITQSILSAYERSYLLQLLKDHRIENYFTDVIAFDENPGRKKTDLGRKWLEKSGLKPSEILLIGDTVHDYEVARALGTRCALVSRGFQDASLLESLPVPVYPSLLDLFLRG